MFALLIKECHQPVINLNKFCPTLGIIPGRAAMTAVNAQRLTVSHCKAGMQCSVTLHAQKPQDTSTSTGRRICGRKPGQEKGPFPAMQ